MKSEKDAQALLINFCNELGFELNTKSDKDWINLESHDEDEITKKLIKGTRHEIIHRTFLRLEQEAIDSDLETDDEIEHTTEYISPKLIKSENIKYYNFNEVFHFIPSSKVYIKEGQKLIPLYGATTDNVPSKFVNYYRYDSNDVNNPIFSINNVGNGECGIVHVMKGKFAVLSRYCFQLNNNLNFQIDFEITASLISYYLHEISGYSRSKSITKINFNEKIPIYVIEEEN